MGRKGEVHDGFERGNKSGGEGTTDPSKQAQNAC
jgi:hypothetical protein